MQFGVVEAFSYGIVYVIYLYIYTIYMKLFYLTESYWWKDTYKMRNRVKGHSYNTYRMFYGPYQRVVKLLCFCYGSEQFKIFRFSISLWWNHVILYSIGANDYQKIIKRKKNGKKVELEWPPERDVRLIVIFIKDVSLLSSMMNERMNKSLSCIRAKNIWKDTSVIIFIET